MAKHDWPGFLFIVGLPRSGTKLLRSIIDQHPRVCLVPEETHFIPSFMEKYGDRLDLSRSAEAFKDLRGTPFYWNMKQRGIQLEAEAWHKIHHQSAGEWAHLLQLLLAFYTRSAGTECQIFGDKTPGYLKHLKLLEHTLPNAKFIHIIRDPRDYCLSVRRAWGKSVLRAAHRWKIEIESARNQSREMAEKYLELHYEALILETEKVVREVAEFLELESYAGMLEPPESEESLGEAKGYVGLLRQNTGKYRDAFSKRTNRRIEEITYPVLVSTGYSPEHAEEFHPPSPPLLALHQVYDAFASILFHIRDKGLPVGIWYALSHHYRSSWRE